MRLKSPLQRHTVRLRGLRRPREAGMSAVETRERPTLPCPAPAMPETAERTPSPEDVEAPFLAQVWAVARKDLLLEARSRERLLSMGTFAVLVAVVFSFAVDPTVRARSIAGAM